MKILQYNVLYGWDTEERFKAFESWFNKHDYDVVGLNEMNNWTDEKLRDAAKKWGYSHSYLFQMKSSRFHIGVLSKHPIELIACNEDDFHHGLVHVKIKGIHFFLTHLKPHDSIAREDEAKQLVKRVSQCQEPLILMGDLNTLSPLDDAHYKKMDVAGRLAESELSSQQLKNGKINYLPMETLLNAGLHDVGKTNPFDYSLPTSIKVDPEKAVRRRIDYVLVNNVAKQFDPIASVIHDAEVEKLSDHYPIECLLNQNGHV